MYDLFFERLRSIIPLTAEDEDVFRTYLVPKKLRRRQYLLQEGDIARTVAFVEKGALRAYSVDEKGVEHILDFALEGSFISDMRSFLRKEPSTFNIDALEDCELLQISRTTHEELRRRIPDFSTFLWAEAMDGYLALQRRLTSIMSLSLNERYVHFANLFPDLMQRVPQHMIASYMGLSPETLSRIRGRLKTR